MSSVSAEWDVLHARWRRARLRLRIVTTAQWSVVVLCVVLLRVGTVGSGSPPVWAFASVLGSALPVAVYLSWLRGEGSLRPASWSRGAFAVTGAQQLLGVLPLTGLVLGAGGRGVGGGLAVLAWLCGVMSVVWAGRAHRALLHPLVPALGATTCPVTIAVRFVLTAPAPVSARLDVETGHVAWSAHLHRGRRLGVRTDMAIGFSDLQQVRATELPDRSDLYPWLCLPDGTALYAAPGPALVLSGRSGHWMVPVHDAVLMAELIERRWRLYRAGG